MTSHIGPGCSRPPRCGHAGATGPAWELFWETSPRARFQLFLENFGFRACLRPFLRHYWKLYLWHMPIALLVLSHIVLCWKQTKSNMCWGEVHKRQKSDHSSREISSCAQDLKMCFDGQRLPFWCSPTWKFWLRSLGTIWSKKYLKN